MAYTEIKEHKPLEKCFMCGEKKQIVYAMDGSMKHEPEIMIKCPNCLGVYCMSYNEWKYKEKEMIDKLIDAYNRRA